MIGRMLANQVDDRNVGPAGIVQIRKTVPQAGSKMQQGARRFFSDPSVTVSGACDHSFEQA